MSGEEQAEAKRRAVHRFFEGLSGGAFPGDLFAPDLKCWSTAGDMAADLYLSVPVMLKKVFPQGIAFQVDSLIVDEDRAAAEARSNGIFDGDQLYSNRYAFVFGFTGGKISSVAEHFNPLRVPAALGKQMTAALSGLAG